MSSEREAAPATSARTQETDLPLSDQDTAVLDVLAEAGALYERYLQVSQVGALSLLAYPEDIESLLPPDPSLPLTLEFRPS